MQAGTRHVPGIRRLAGANRAARRLTVPWVAKQRLKSPRGRLFVALDLPGDVREGIAAWQAAELTDPALRVVPAENLHITLVFLGWQAEKDFDSIAEATGYLNNAPRVNGGFNPNGQPNTPRAEFIQKFTNPHEKRTESQTSILQALFLMNGKHTEDVLKNSKSLRTVQENVQGGTRRNLEELYIVTLSRKPRADELAWLTEYVESGGPTKDRKDALADVFWALINSGEFMLNH